MVVSADPIASPSLGRLWVCARVREWFCDNLRLIRVNDVAHAIFSQDVDNMTISFQDALDLAHSRNVLQGVITEPRNPSRVLSIEPFR